jgi:hypothetical protein
MKENGDDCRREIAGMVKNNAVSLWYGAEYRCRPSSRNRRRNGGMKGERRRRQRIINGVARHDRRSRIGGEGSGSNVI